MRREILELLLVGLVGENIIAVSALDFSVFFLFFFGGIGLLLAHLFKVFKSLVIKCLEVHDFTGVTLLKNGPFEVIFIDRLEIVGQVLIYLEASD